MEKRKKRPSWSPQKPISNHAPEQPRKRSQSDAMQKELPDVNLAMANPKTASLEFEEFSYVDEKGMLKSIPPAWLEILVNYLSDVYQATSVDESLPYLIVWCHEKIPLPSERPFMIAGLVGVWLVEGKDGHPREMLYGDIGDCVDNHWVDLEQDQLDDLTGLAFPKAETLATIMDQHFPEALAISFLTNTIVVELKHLTDAEHMERCLHFPQLFAGTDVCLRYHNGPLHTQEPKRSKEPDPTKLDGQYDDTDYVKERGCFQPGALLSTKSNSLISAGILVRKGVTTGLTVSIHAWDPQLDQDVQFGHEDFTLKQGNWADGTTVGVVTERIRTTDIGIAKVEKPFFNQFLDLQGSASRFMHSTETKFGDQFWIDSYVTGAQRLAGLGKRVVKADQRGRDFFGSENPQLAPGTYIKLKQGIWATSAPEITGLPKTRSGVCGAAIMRARQEKRSPKVKNEPSDSQRSSTEVSTPAKGILSGKDHETPSSAPVTLIRKQLSRQHVTGEVAGFMHWVDSPSPYNVGTLLCFGDAVDDLMDEGWEVVPVAEKRKASAAGLDDDSDPFVTKEE